MSEPTTNSTRLCREPAAAGRASRHDMLDRRLFHRPWSGESSQFTMGSGSRFGRRRLRTQAPTASRLMDGLLIFHRMLTPGWTACPRCSSRTGFAATEPAGRQADTQTIQNSTNCARSTVRHEALTWPYPSRCRHCEISPWCQSQCLKPDQSMPGQVSFGEGAGIDAAKEKGPEGPFLDSPRAIAARLCYPCWCAGPVSRQLVRIRTRSRTVFEWP